MNAEERSSSPVSPAKKPRKDRGTRRFMLPVSLAKSLVTHAIDRSISVEALLREMVEAYETPPARITLPPSVLARLAPAAEGSGRPVSELLAEMEGELCLLLDGELFRWIAEEDDYASIPSLVTRLVEAFRARVTTTIPAATSATVAEFATAFEAAGIQEEASSPGLPALPIKDDPYE